MKRFLIGSVGLVSAIAIGTPSLAQTAAVKSLPSTPPQSELLNTQPASIERSPLTSSADLTSEQRRLTDIAKSIQANPQSAQPQGGGIPDNLIPKDLFHFPSKTLSDEHPLEQFQPQDQTRSLGINLIRD